MNHNEQVEKYPKVDFDNLPEPSLDNHAFELADGSQRWLGEFTPIQQEILLKRTYTHSWGELDQMYPKEEMEKLYTLLYATEIRCRVCGRSHERPACTAEQEAQRQKLLKCLTKAFEEAFDETG